jgi:hypothetical protein
MISTTADATHFVNCRGRIELSDCRFANQKDDATNVHGVYTIITGRPDPRSVEVRLMHHQQVGRHPADIGHVMQFVKRDTLLPCHHATVTGVRRINKERTVLTFAEPLPTAVGDSDAVLDLHWIPSAVVLRRCELSGNRARGFLVSVASPTLIEDCTFRVPGAAILVEGDANFWFESGPVADLTIRNNRFLACNFGVWGGAAIQVSPGIKPTFRRSPRYHRNITIEKNRFEVFFPVLVQAHSVDGLVFRDNEVVSSTAYPARKPDLKPFAISDCSNVTLPADAR